MRMIVVATSVKVSPQHFSISSYTSKGSFANAHTASAARQSAPADGQSRHVLNYTGGKTQHINTRTQAQALHSPPHIPHPPTMLTQLQSLTHHPCATAPSSGPPKPPTAPSLLASSPSQQSTHAHCPASPTPAGRAQTHNVLPSTQTFIPTRVSRSTGRSLVTSSPSLLTTMTIILCHSLGSE